MIKLYDLLMEQRRVYKWQEVTSADPKAVKSFEMSFKEERGVQVNIDDIVYSFFANERKMLPGGQYNKYMTPDYAFILKENETLGALRRKNVARYSIDIYYAKNITIKPGSRNIVKGISNLNLNNVYLFSEDDVNLITQSGKSVIDQLPELQPKQPATNKTNTTNTDNVSNTDNSTTKSDNNIKIIKSRNSKGDSVKRIQISLGMPNPTGVWDIRTEAWMWQWCKENKITPSKNYTNVIEYAMKSNPVKVIDTNAAEKLYKQFNREYTLKIKSNAELIAKEIYDASIGGGTDNAKFLKAIKRINSEYMYDLVNMELARKSANKTHDIEYYLKDEFWQVKDIEIKNKILLHLKTYGLLVKGSIPLEVGDEFKLKKTFGPEMEKFANQGKADLEKLRSQVPPINSGPKF